VTDSNKSQEEKILWVLQAAGPNWTPAPELSRIALQYSRAVSGLRKKGWLISNRVEIVNGVKHGFFRLGPQPVPSRKELCRSASPEPITESLFPETARHRDDG
jgi:hypothetical protein